MAEKLTGRIYYFRPVCTDNYVAMLPTTMKEVLTKSIESVGCHFGRQFGELLRRAFSSSSFLYYSLYSAAHHRYFIKDTDCPAILTIISQAGPDVIDVSSL